MIQSVANKYAPVKDDPEELSNRIVSWGMEFFGDPRNRAHYWLRDPIPDFHHDIYAALANDYQYYYVTAPRGRGKSTVVQLVYPLYRIVYNLDPYILLIEKNEKAAIRVLDNVKYELRNNYKLQEVYGDLRPVRSRKEEDYRYSKSESRFINGCFLRCVGMMGDVRGGLDRMYRYTLIIANDPQNMKTMRESGTLKAHTDFWERDVEEAIDHIYGKVRMVGNLLGTGCLLESVVNDPKYDGVNFSALVNDNGEADLNGHSIWEERFPTIKVKEKLERARKRGKLHVFMAEEMNIITDEGKRTLKGYRYHDCTFINTHGQNQLISDMWDTPIPVNTYYCIDPAFSKADDADPRAGVVIALGRFPERDYEGRTIFVNGVWVLEVNFGYGDPSALIDGGLELHVKYRFKALVIEANGPQQIFEYIGNKALLQNEFVFKNPIQFIPVPHVSGRKEDRIYEALSVKCKLGQFFIRPDMHSLKSELDLFLTNPDGLHITDAIAMGLKWGDVSSESPMNEERRIKRYREQQAETTPFNLSNPLSIYDSMIGEAA